MDILHLVDRLEELFNQSSAIPLSKKVAVDEEKLLDLIDQMRLAVPAEIKKAQSIINQQERIIAQAHEEASRTVALAKEQAEKLVSKDVIVQDARISADNIVRQAEQETKMMKLEADQYAIDSLDHLEIELSKILTQVRNGITSLRKTAEENISPNPAPAIDPSQESTAPDS